MSTEKSNYQRSRNYACIVYPESALPDWQERLFASCIPCFISPLHNKDVADDGSLKKAHYHVLWQYGGSAALSTARAFACDILGSAYVEQVHNFRAYARYLCHLDSPDKASYSPSDVVSSGGLSYASYASQSGLLSEIDMLFSYAVDVIVQGGFRSYFQLTLHAKQTNDDMLLKACSRCSSQIRAILKSASWEDSMAVRKPSMPT